MKVSANIHIVKLHIKAMTKGKVSENDLRKALKSANNSSVDFKKYMYTKETLDGIKDILRNQNSNRYFKKLSLINELEFLITPTPRESIVDTQALPRLHYLNQPGESFA